MESVATSLGEGEVVMEVLASRVLVHPTDFERSFRFYAESLGLHVYREWGRGSTRGVVFFLVHLGGSCPPFILGPTAAKSPGTT
jgi:catechol 2,3-dioxygenase-like lactoylglutathione lyase family enzyme